MLPPPEPDPRPLTGEPLSIDLLNTRWIDSDGRHDLLESVEGLGIWLAGPLVRQELGDRQAVADRQTLDALLQVRGALDGLVATPGPWDEATIGALNAVLAHGLVRRLLLPDGAGSAVEVDPPSWLAAWTVAENFLHLLGERPERIRSCANPECVLHFYDVSKNGTRRWCSMAGCGNRAKANRHYARHNPG
ncbi:MULTISPECIES: CGNR zinc finger domain-containing protein [Streptomyces]|uniref:CGNR zinc finger domain-containing protein n=1 Tax=Streptomyces TaxID=1883 RepID=UPI00227014C4|nr:MULTISPECIES: CGNR zinc finger domain-containing protein [unclassified Streptomyces]MCY0939858.1 CGNR zinc finger domain-containing protein [Streptomyces sp. H34-AA3]MCY0949953.1 CGNR zinc finger domain-containing protein [Streptomyces sp. H27-S2]MCZ4081028.1 CGNR zinc finger domain-containing protein [Streptomyces sp. H34-S5]